MVTNGVAFGMVFGYRQIIQDDPTRFQALIEQSTVRPELCHLCGIAIARILLGESNETNLFIFDLYLDFFYETCFQMSTPLYY